jgi:hypothetical protein
MISSSLAADYIGFDPITGTYHARHDDEPTPPTIAVVEAVAAAEGCDPLDLPSLYDVVDTDAVDELVSDPDRPIKIAFDYAGHSVSVSSWGGVVVSDATQ